MAEPNDQPIVPQRLGDFKIIRELGRGGMGIVYDARQVSLNRQVALKVLSGSLGLTAKAVQRFRREAEAAARLHHTNIVPVYATGEENGTHYYAMELVDGPSLDKVLRQLRQTHQAKPAPPAPAPQPSTVDEAPPGEALPPWVEQSFAPATPASAPAAVAGQSSSDLGSGSGYFDAVARMLAEVADALDYAHGQGVIHRDIKPSNLLLAPSGRLSVNDFGLARMLEQPGMTLTGEFVGTPKYMSPEQVAAGRIPLDHRTDIYSLGATLYELLTLQPPFSGGSRDQVLAQILQKEPRPPRKLNKKVPVDLETICLKALDKDPDRRYQTAGLMAEDLRRYVNRFAIAARRAGPVERLKKWLKRRPGLAAALGAVVLAVALAGLFAHRAHLAEQRRLAEQQHLEQQLRDERRQAALEKALLVAMSGNPEEAELAIHDAERQGISLGQARLLRGQLAFSHGREAEAIGHLEKAVGLLPIAQSAAARGLLAVAYMGAGHGNEVERTMRELEPISPVTLEDYLFKGAAIGLSDPERGLQLMDEAVRQRPSSAIARVLRADARAALALDRGDPHAADRAIEDAEAAKRRSPENNPVALWESAFVYQCVAGVYQAAGLEQRYQAALAQAEKDAEALQAFPDLPSAVLARMGYFWNYAQKDRTLDELRRLARQTDLPLVACYGGCIHYWRGTRSDLQEARALLQTRQGNPQSDLVRCCVLAELESPESALAAYQQMVAGNQEGYHRLRSYTVLFLLGRKDLAKAQSQQDRQRGLSFPPRQRVFFEKLLDFFAGDLSEAGLLEAAAGTNSRWNQLYAHYFVGLARLAEADRAGAHEQFQKALATRVLLFLPYDLTMVFLARMDKDDTWPPGIPLKK